MRGRPLLKLIFSGVLHFNSPLRRLTHTLRAYVTGPDGTWRFTPQLTLYYYTTAAVGECQRRRYLTEYTLDWFCTHFPRHICEAFDYPKYRKCANGPCPPLTTPIRGLLHNFFSQCTWVSELGLVIIKLK